MKLDYKRKQAAQKAVITLRLNLLSKANLSEVIKVACEIREKQFEIDDDFSREGIMARELGKTTWQSFCRFGNRRSATPALILYWIDNSEMSLDEQAMWITEKYGIEFSPDHLAEFMMNHDRGKLMFIAYQELSEFKKLFHEMAGFRWDNRFVKNHIMKTALEDNPF